MGDERPTLDDWTAGRVPAKSRAEIKADWVKRTQERHDEHEKLRERLRLALQGRRDLYRRLLP